MNTGEGTLRLFALIAAALCCLAVFVDAFQTIILPRRATGRFRITRFFTILTWTPWTAIGGRMKSPRAREQFYSFYGPLSLILLLLLWALVLILGFALFYFALGTPFVDPLGVHTLSGLWRIRTDLYVSGTTLFTLGLGDVVPHSIAARSAIILESGVGLAFVALVIGYLPVLYQAFSRREVSIALLDARAGSPPTATELLRRHGFDGGEEALIELLMEWERWSAEILESHISYPILCFYRSQHDNQSWLSGLVAMLDTCALLISVLEGPASRQAQLTFVMARHALIDVANVFHVKEQRLWETAQANNRLGSDDFARLCDVLADMGLRLCADRASAERLETVRALYEPYAGTLSLYLRMPLPPWVAEKREKDQWKLLNKLRTEAEATREVDPQARRKVTSAMMHDEHGH